MQGAIVLKIISGIKKNAALLQPKTFTRPTMQRVRKLIFDTIYDFVPNSVVLDAFAGSGAMAFEALSIGAKQAYLFDTSKEAIDVILKNANKLNFLDRIDVKNSDFLKTKKDLSCVNLTFIDPPYKNFDYNEILQKLISLNISGIVVIESESNIELNNFQNIQIINVKTIAKKTLYFIKITLHKE